MPTPIANPNRVLTDQQYEKLQSDILSDNRISFYIRLYEYTKSDVALMMSQISSASSFTGGVAWAINNQIKEKFPDRYTISIPDFSKVIAINDFRLIRLVDGHRVVPTDLEMLKGARAMWDRYELGQYFPGNGRMAWEYVKEGDLVSAVKVLNESKSLALLIPNAVDESFDFVLGDTPVNWGRSVQECLDLNPGATVKNLTVESRHIAEIIGKDGKTVCVFPDKIVNPAMPKLGDSLKGLPGDLASLDISQDTVGKAKVAWHTNNGFTGLDTYDVSQPSGRLQSKTLTCQFDDGKFSQESIAFKSDGTVLRDQLVTSIKGGSQAAYLQGESIDLWLTRGDIHVVSGSKGQIVGDGNHVTADGGNIMAWVYGDQTITTSKPTGNTIALIGKSVTGIGDKTDFWMSEGSTGAIIGQGNTVIGNGANVKAWVYGDNAFVFSNSPESTFSLSGHGQTAGVQNGAVWFAENSDGGVYGDGNFMVANGTNVKLWANGSSSVVVSEQAGNIISFNGDKEWATASGSTVWFGPNADGVVKGSNNQLVGNGQGVEAIISGISNKVVAARPGNVFTVTESQRTELDTSSCKIFVVNGSDQTDVIGNDNFFENGVAYSHASLRGDRNYIHATQPGSLISVTGRDVVIDAPGNAILVEPGSSVRILSQNTQVHYWGDVQVDAPAGTAIVNESQPTQQPVFHEPSRYVGGASASNFGVQISPAVTFSDLNAGGFLFDGSTFSFH